MLMRKHYIFEFSRQYRLQSYWQTRMHSSRMRTIRCSGRVPVEGLSAQGGVCVSVGGVSAQGGVCLGLCLPGGRNPPCEQNHRQV